MERAETGRFLVSCHRQQQELLTALLDKVYLGSRFWSHSRGVSRDTGP